MIDALKNRIFNIAGNDERGWPGDDGLAKKASLEVHSLRMDSRSGLFFADYHHHFVRMIEFPPK
jgi:hypothetical protein